METEFAFDSERIFRGGEKSGIGGQDKEKPESASWWKRLLQEVRESFDAPFTSKYENETGLRWREWGKL